MTTLNCLYGNHGPKRTWCRHDEIRGQRRSISVANHRCESCPLYQASNGEPRPRPTVNDTSEREPCVRQLPILEQVDCKACGGSVKQFPVHGCQIHGECAVSAYHWEKLRENGRSVKNCQTCKEYQAMPLNLPSVTVVIPCHNYGEFLQEAIESLHRQTHPPVEIVVVDDNSTDNTREVAERMGVTYIRSELGNVFEARKLGYQSTQSDLLCFLDADDYVADDYLEQAARLMQQDWRLGIVFSDMERFGAEQGRTQFPVYFDPVRFQRDNYLHAGSVVRRSALRITQAFETPRPSHLTHEDWLLWSRVLDAGWHAQKSNAIYYYRRHPNGSMITGRKNKSWYFRLGHNRSPVTILIPLAGRHQYFDELFSFLDRQTWPRKQCRLVLGDTSQDPEYTQRVKEWIARSDYQDVRHMQFAVGAKGIADADRKQVYMDVQDAVLRCWSRLTKTIDTNWTFCLEDDVIPPDDIVERLFKDLQGGVDAVVGPYMSRMLDHWTVYRDGKTVLPRQERTGMEKIDGAGFGCMLIRSHLLKNHVWTHGPRQGDWYDPWFAKATGLQMLCDWDIPVRHLPAEDAITIHTT